MQKISKKVLFTFISTIAVIGYGYFVYAAAPTGGYTPGSTLDPNCAPGSTDCTVTLASGGTISIGDLIGNTDPNSILYTNGDGELTVDSLFTRDSSTKETQIMRSFNSVGTSEITVTTKPIFANLENGAIIPFQEGESFTTTPAGVTGTIVRVENQTFGQAQGMETTPVFSGTGPNDLSVSADDYIEQDPRNFTVTITHKDLPYASVSMSGSPFIPGETITGQSSGATAQIVYADYTYAVLENIVGIFDSYEFVTSDSSSGNLSITGGTTDMITVNNTDTTVAMPIIVTGNTAINGVYVYFSSYLGHEIGDQWTFTVSYGFPQFTVLYLDNVSGASVSTDGYSIVGASSGQTMNGVLYIPPLGAVGDTVRMFNVSDFNQTTGSGTITAINDGVYTISGTGSPNASDVIMNMSDNTDGNLSFVYSATSEEIPSLVTTGFVSSNNILGLGVKGTGLVQSNNNSGVFSGVYDASSFGGSDMSIGLSYFGPNDELASVNVNGGTSPTITLSSSTSSGDGFLTISPTSFLLETRQNGNTLFGFEADTSTIGWRSGNERYFLPTTMPNNGDVLSVTNINGNEITLGFTSSGGGGGSSAISVNGTTLYSSGLSGTGDFNGYNIFLGTNAGNGTTGAYNSNFFGTNAGNGATNAAYSNFLGFNSGQGATNASDSNFLGRYAGYGATGAYNSNFFGANAGNGAINAYNSNFFGSQAGWNATNAQYSNFLGLSAGYQATNASYSNFLGYYAGSSATDAISSNFLGYYAGYGATGANSSNFLGYEAGVGATGANGSNFLGIRAGKDATGAYGSNFIGANAGQIATGAYYSSFFGTNAGYGAAGAYKSSFLGYEAGQNAANANNSNFFGDQAGTNATNASFSSFIGSSAGAGAVNASNSIFIGKESGFMDLVNNSTNNDYSILIGPNTSTGNNGSGVGYSNSIALGAYATNTASNQFMIGSATRPIDEIRVVQAGGTECIIDTSGLGCTSDERLKTNITDLTTDTLDKVLNIKTVTYNWLNNPDGKTMTGFLAQDLEQYFPELVATNERGQKSVYYAQMTPILVQAIREMNLKITTINDMETPNTWRDSLIAWFGNVENGIVKFFADELETKNLCITDDAGEKTCITKTQLDQLLNGSGVSASPSPEQVSGSESEPESDTGTTSDVSDNESPVGDNEPVSTDETPSDPVASGDVSTPSTENPAESPVETPSETPSETTGSNDESASTGESTNESGSI